MNNTEILAIYGTEYKEMTKTLLKEANLAEQIPDKDCRIGIKPNLVSPSEASWGATTHPEIVAGIIEYLQEHGFFNLVILEGSWVGDKTAEAAELCGYYDMSRNYQVEFLSICLPPFLHCQVAIDCMLAGKHVLVEKPMAPTLEECDEMIRVQREMGCYLGVISQNRYTKDNFFLKSMIEHGKLGSVFMGEVKSCWYRGESYYLPQWRGTWELEGGGCILNHSIHQIDLLNWILGKPCEVYAVTANLNHPNSEVEDLAAAILQYSNDVVVTLNTSLISHGEEQLIRIQGSTASLSAPFAVECNIQREDGFPMVNEKYKEQLKREYEEMKVIHYTGFSGQIAEVLETDRKSVV